jgi:Plasmid stabilisation system protein.
MVPEMGRKDKFREIIYGNYRIIYNIADSHTVNILTVHHSSKRLRQTSLQGSK